MKFGGKKAEVYIHCIINNNNILGKFLLQEDNAGLGVYEYLTGVLHVMLAQNKICFQYDPDVRIARLPTTLRTEYTTL